MVDCLIADSKLYKAVGGALLAENNNRAFLKLDDVFSTTVVREQPGKLKAEPEPVGFGLVHRISYNQIYCALMAVPKEFKAGFVNVEELVVNKADVKKGEKEENEENDDDCCCVYGNEKSSFGRGKQMAARRMQQQQLGKKKKKQQQKHSFLKISEFREALPDLSGLPQYFSAFGEPLARPLLQCMVERLANDCFGGSTFNLELRRNMTVDLYDSESGISEHSDSLWRDAVGFIVADRFRYFELHIKRNSLLAALQTNKNNRWASSPLKAEEEEGKEEKEESADEVPTFELEALSPATLPLFLSYDQSICAFGRDEYLEFLFALDGIRGVVAIDLSDKQPLGYALVLAGRVLQCYAESEQIACALVSELFTAEGTNNNKNKNNNKNNKNHSLNQQKETKSSCLAMVDNEKNEEEGEEEKNDDEIVCLFVRLGAFGAEQTLGSRLLPAAERALRLRRFHSRVVPSSVQWAKVFVPNIGAHLF